MGDALACWKCGAPLASVPLPLGRRDECPSCGADLHVCRMCLFHDPHVSRGCREPVAEDVGDKERANFCGYFQPNPGAYRPATDDAGRAARARLDALFGQRPGDGPAGAPAAADEAREQLKKLFGDDGGKT